MADGKLAFGPFMLDASRGALLRDGAPVALGQRALAVLVALGETPGLTVAKDDLLARVWPGTLVEEGNLTVQIAALRKALGPAPDGRDWIVTVPRIGYRLVRDDGSASAGAGTEPPGLTVLPFQVLGGATGDGYFADGVAEDITTALGRFRSVRVLTAAPLSLRDRPAHEVAQETGRALRAAGQPATRRRAAADHRRTGRRRGRRASLGADLRRDGRGRLRVPGPHHRERRHRDRAADPGGELGRFRRERPKSAAAYDIFLQARAKLFTNSERENAEVYRLITEALALEPDNARMLALAAGAIEHRGAMGWPPFGPDDRERCADFARRGIQHAAGDGTVLAHCGIALVQCVKDYDWGMAVLTAAVEDNPNDLVAAVAAATGHLHCGSLDTALALFARALRLNPRHPFAHIAHTGMAHAHIVRGDYPDALESAARARALNTNFDATLWMLTAANAHLGRMDEARHFLAPLLELAPGVTIARIRAGQPAKDPGRIEPILQGLRLAGLPET